MPSTLRDRVGDACHDADVTAGIDGIEGVEHDNFRSSSSVRLPSIGGSSRTRAPLHPPRSSSAPVGNDILGGFALVNESGGGLPLGSGRKLSAAQPMGSSGGGGGGGGGDGSFLRDAPSPEPMFGPSLGAVKSQARAQLQAQSQATLNPKPYNIESLNPTPQTLNPRSYILNPKPYNIESLTLKPKPQTLNPRS
jgi:hypothetical protein